MSKNIRLSKGLNINLKGEAEKVLVNAPHPESVALKPTDFHMVTPRLLVKEGDEVKAGTPLFYDKKNERIRFVSPVSGEIAAIVRGEKRRILEIRILADKDLTYVQFPQEDPRTLSREQIIERLLEGGAWPFMRQRPFNIMADPADKPKSIFISAFDSAPLAPDNDFILHGNGEIFQKGLDALVKLTDGKVHLNVNGKSTPSKVFTNSKGVQINQVSGPHPAGNPGIQIHHIDPIGKNEIVWFLQPQDVLLIGRLFAEGRHNAQRVVALTGPRVKNPKYYKSIIGASIKSLTEGAIESGNNRYISGNVLTGTKTSTDGYLSYYDSQLCVITEGDQPEFMGWATPGLNKFSASRAFFSWLMPGKKYDLDTNLHGEERPFVVTGEYNKVLPMNIHPVHLLKSILVEDIELMENLGIYEVGEEDFALCEFVCTSKINVQDIVRKGLDMVKQEMS